MSYSSSKSRAFDFASMSYRMIRDHKKLGLFPFLSALSLALICSSFWLNGSTSFLNKLDDIILGHPFSINKGNYLSLFSFYFINYFCIVFFNCALFACVMQILKRGKTSLWFGITLAIKRIPYIVGWSLISATIGIILRIIERRQAGTKLVAALIGTAWAALTYFAIPVIVTNGCNPISAIRKSKDLVKATWGTALMGNFSMGIFDILLFLPVAIIGGLIIVCGHVLEAPDVVTIGWIVFYILFAIYLVVATAAHEIFRAYTFAYATGRELPRWISPSTIRKAFKQR